MLIVREDELASEKVLKENYWIDKVYVNLCYFLTTTFEIPHSSCVRGQHTPSHVSGRGIWEMCHHLHNQTMR